MDVIMGGLAVLQQHWVLTSVLVFSILVYLHYVATFSEIKKLGLPGPTPWPIFGNSIGFLLMRKPLHEFFGSLVKQYGNICGIYFLKEPGIIVSDPDIIKSILVKDFEKFQDRVVSMPFMFTLFAHLNTYRGGARKIPTGGWCFRQGG